MRGLMILVAGGIGAAAGVFAAVMLIAGLRGHGGGAPAWEFALIASLGGMGALVFSVLAAWMTAAADTDQLAVRPTRHLMTLTTALIGGAAGLALYAGLAAASGGAVPAEAGRVFAGALMLLGGLAGLGLGRALAVKAYY